jgi:hypothetical protein
VNRFLACLLALAILGCSCAVRTTLRRGNEIRRLAACPVCHKRHWPYCPTSVARHLQLTDEILFWSGSFSGFARTAARLTAATTAGSTTTGTGGSRAPASAGGPFGMCMYPERKTRPASPGIDTEDPDA